MQKPKPRVVVDTEQAAKENVLKIAHDLGMNIAQISSLLIEIGVKTFEKDPTIITRIFGEKLKEQIKD